MLTRCEHTRNRLHIKTMMDIGREEGYEAGIETGKRESIYGAISIMKKMNTSDEDIIMNIVNTYDITEGEALTYLSQ